METREYSPRTIVAYRSRLKLLLMALEEGVIKQEDLDNVKQEVLELQTKLGPLIESPKKQGRPRKYVKLTMEEVERIKAGKEVDKLSPGYWSPEAIEMRRKVKQMQVNPSQEEVEASAKALEEMQTLTPEQLIEKANDELVKGGNDEGPKQATHESGEVTGTDRTS